MINVYYADKQHEQNFKLLQEKFKYTDFSKNGEYRSVCYLAAYEGIFKCINLERTKNGPFDFYYDYLDNPDDFIDRRDRGETAGDTAPLTGQTREMVKIGMSLWNGESCDLSAVADMDPVLYLVVLQALDLRRRAPSFDYTAYAIQNMDGWYETIFRKQN